MIKKSIFTLLLFVAMGCLSAQSLRLEWDGTEYPNDTSIVCETEEYGEYVQHFRVRNLTGSTMNVMLEKEILEDKEGVSNYFCFGSCYMPETMITPRPVEVPAQALAEEELSVHALFEENVYGYVVVKYYLYDVATPEDRLSFIVKFHRSGVGVDEQMQCNLGQAYPNPASSVVRFDYDLSEARNASVSVFNLLGQEVLRQELSAMQGQVVISVADLNEGIYFCNLKVNGQAVSTEKFVVKK